MKKGLIVLMVGVVFVMGLSVSLSQLKPIFIPHYSSKVALQYVK